MNGVTDTYVKYVAKLGKTAHLDNYGDRFGLTKNSLESRCELIVSVKDSGLTDQPGSIKLGMARHLRTVWYHQDKLQPQS